jgi:molybdate transport system permease protein
MNKKIAYVETAGRTSPDRIPEQVSGGKERETSGRTSLQWWRRPSPLTIICGGMLALFLIGIIGLITADLSYLGCKGISWKQAIALLGQERIIFAIRMSVATSLISLILIMITAIPAGYALSRFRFPGRSFADTLVDIPIVMPPVVAGISLLAFFSFGFGEPLRRVLETFHLSLVSGIGIVMCQYLVAVSYCIRSAKSAFAGIETSLEQVALVMGCSQWQAFRRVSLPMARNGLIAGGVMAWARAIGTFSPIMVLVGTGPRVTVMPTNLWLELSIGNIETAVCIALIMLFMAGAALTIVHWLAPGGSTI